MFPNTRVYNKFPRKHVFSTNILTHIYMFQYKFIKWLNSYKKTIVNRYFSAQYANVN